MRSGRGRHLDDLGVNVELVGGRCDLLPANGAQAGHAAVPVALQLEQVTVAELGTVLKLTTTT